jgi:hypothetical protein
MDAEGNALGGHCILCHGRSGACTIAKANISH